MALVFRVRPNLVLVNGPNIAVPVCYAAILLKLLMVRKTSVFYIESACRVRTLSWSGRFIYPISSRFYVQWAQLAAQYPSARLLPLISL